MVRTIEMTIGELTRKTIVERVRDRGLTQKEAAKKLGISERQFRRILKRYREEGDAGLVSQKRGRPSNRKTDQEVLKAVWEFIRDPDKQGFGPTFMTEKLEAYQGIKLSVETVRQQMIMCGVWKAKSKKDVTIHYPRPRRACRGELIQIDGSEHAWLEDRAPKANLLVFIDDATSEILAARFVPEESFFSYGDLCKSYFRTHGLPKGFYSDRLSVFSCNKAKRTGEETVTQFQRVLSVLKVELILANSPQAKGRVERCNKTLQDRLIKELRLRKIISYEDANAYLPDFIADYNRRFAVCPKENANLHRVLDDTEDLDFLFSVHDFRTITKALQINYQGKTYQIKTKQKAFTFQNQEVLITRDSKGVISAWLHGSFLNLEEVEKRPRQFVTKLCNSPAAKPVLPDYKHPWRTYGKKLNGRPVLTTMLIE